MRTTPLLVLSAWSLMTATALPSAVATVAGGGPAGEAGSPADLPAARGAEEKGRPPAGPNPYLALTPDATSADYALWSAFLETRSRERAALRESTVTTQEEGPEPGQPLVVEEREPEGARGENDTIGTAERISAFGTGRREHHAAQVLGSLVSPDGDEAALSPSTEDDGSIPSARDTGVGDGVTGITTSGTIGDGPHGTAGTGTGDFDVYGVTGLAGQQLTVAVDTPASELDPAVLLFTADGALVAFSDDSPEGPDSLLEYPVPADGRYYAFVTGFPTFPQDPFDSGSGDGAGSEGAYDLAIAQVELDTDIFAVDLDAGDVLGLSASGGTAVDVLDPDGTLVHGSAQDASAVYPVESPLPGGGNAVNDHVADVDGWHYVAVRGTDGDYELTAEVYRPGLEGQRHEQTLFLDLDGARVNTGPWGGPGVRQLSPLRSFLGKWGLSEDDYEPLVEEIVATVRENVQRDLRRNGQNPDFEVRVRNSLEHRDPFGQDNVSRVVVGGTIDEAGVPTIGIASSIDPGNFDQEETALVLLDVLSSDPEAFGDASLNYYLTPESDRVAFVGQAVGNIASHEAGHFFGNWHVEPFNEVLNLMDQGGNFPLLYGAGPDGVGGTEDDWDVDFGEDVFVANEGFTGLEDTLSRLATVLTD